MTDVAPLPGGGFVAVGYVPPDWLPVSWTSTDGNNWTIHSMGTTEFTFPVALAVSADGTIVAVGRSGRDPVAWTSTDGVTWERHTVPALGEDGIAERITTVTASAQGLVAGGSMGPELFDRSARFWRSEDGIDWTPIPDNPVAFANAEVRSITAVDGGFVAVGVAGSAQAATAAVAWTSAAGEHWTRVDDPSFGGAEMVSITPAPFGGLVAVGSLVDRRSAMAWTSPDGRIWARSLGGKVFEHSGGFAWMTDVAAIGDLVISVGDIQGLQRGTAMAWVSRDGTSWERAREAPVQEGAEFYAIAQGGPGALVVGAFGAPDSYVPEVWITPGH